MRIKDIVKICRTDQARPALTGLCFKDIEKTTYIFAVDGYMAIAIDLGEKLEATKDYELFIGDKLRDLIYFVDASVSQKLPFVERLKIGLQKMKNIEYVDYEESFPKLWEGIIELDKAKQPIGALASPLQIRFIMKLKPFLEGNGGVVDFRQGDKEHSAVYVGGTPSNITIVIMPLKGENK